MSESTRRRRYRYDRILIESARILSPQFDDAVLYFTGAQVELLRNVAEYLRRLETYTAEYHLGYYLTPNAVDYDALMAIVADLEETLMGNPNTIWGYKDTKHLNNDSTVSGAGTKTLNFGAVPAGQLWRIEAFTARNADTACSKIDLVADLPTGDVRVYRKDSPAADELIAWDGMLTLKVGSTLYARFYDCADGDYIVADARGYIMEVPE